MDISIFGASYMGLVSSACLAEMDHNVTSTERQQFRIPNKVQMATRMRGKVIVDVRNLHQPLKLQAEGWTNYFVGHGTIDLTE